MRYPHRKHGCHRFPQATARACIQHRVRNDTRTARRVCHGSLRRTEPCAFAVEMSPLPSGDAHAAELCSYAVVVADPQSGTISCHNGDPAKSGISIQAFGSSSMTVLPIVAARVGQRSSAVILGKFPTMSTCPTSALSATGCSESPSPGPDLRASSHCSIHSANSQIRDDRPLPRPDIFTE